MQQQVEISTWLLKIFRFCDETVSLLQKIQLKVVRKFEVRLSVKYFFKPVRPRERESRLILIAERFFFEKTAACTTAHLLAWL